MHVDKQINKKWRFLNPFSNDLLSDISRAFNNDVCIVLNSSILDDCDKIIANNIFILTDDHLGDDENNLLPISRRPLSRAEYLKQIALANKHKKFYIATCCPFVWEKFTKINNVKIIHYCDDFLIHPTTSALFKVIPIREKRFAESWHWVCLNYNLRMHRAICVMYLLGEQIAQGFLTLDSSLIMCHESFQTFLYYLNSNDYHYIQSITTESETCAILETGFNRIKLVDGYSACGYSHVPPWVSDRKVPWSEKAVSNFNDNLSKFYSNSTIDIITETVFINRTGIITEKYANSVFGFNFPIIIGMQGTISYLRSLGFDMFDDIIDHSYDEIQDHYVRMMMAIKNNRKILEDRQLAIDSWYSCSTRFEKNYSLIVKMYKSTETTAKIKILESIN